jgi:hypothetical protein
MRRTSDRNAHNQLHYLVGHRNYRMASVKPTPVICHCCGRQLSTREPVFRHQSAKSGVLCLGCEDWRADHVDHPTPHPHPAHVA